jgi:hypothetical protein
MPGPGWLRGLLGWSRRYRLVSVRFALFQVAVVMVPCPRFTFLRSWQQRSGRFLS